MGISSLIIVLFEYHQGITKEYGLVWYGVFTIHPICQCLLVIDSEKKTMDLMIVFNL